MKKLWLILVCGFFCFIVFADMRNADKPLKGEWDFRPQKVWEVDNVDDAPFERPSELRGTEDELVCFHDFDQKLSYVFDSNGKFVNSFAKQGTGPGEVDRYINCFIAGDNVVVGTPGRLHFYSKQGTFIESFENNLFARFPLLFLDEYEFLYAPQEMGQPQGDNIKLVSLDLRSKKDKVFAEFSVSSEGKAGSGGPPIVILGLTPQIQVAYDRDSRKFYYGRSDDYTIHVSEATGKKLFSFGLDRERKRVDEEDKRKHFEKSSIPKDRYEKILPALPDVLTHFMRIQVVEGLIFVYSTKSLERQQDKIAVDIFSQKGKYMYRSTLRFGKGISFYTHVEKVIIRGNHCYAILEDGSGKSILAKYKISLPPIQ
jgi:hypothetical protein